MLISGRPSARRNSFRRTSVRQLAAQIRPVALHANALRSNGEICSVRLNNGCQRGQP
jgi:hypothetical protein